MRPSAEPPWRALRHFGSRSEFVADIWLSPAVANVQYESWIYARRYCQASIGTAAACEAVNQFAASQSECNKYPTPAGLRGS